MPDRKIINSYVACLIVCLTVGFGMEMARAGKGESARLLVGEYVLDTTDGTFRSFRLTDRPGTPAKPLKNQTYYRYTAIRKDGAKDKGVWWAVMYKGNKGYLMFESAIKDFMSGKRELQFAIFDVGKGCTLPARPTHVKGWPTKKPQKYTKKGCK